MTPQIVVSWNRGTPQSSKFWSGFSSINKPFWGSPIDGTHFQHVVSKSAQNQVTSLPPAPARRAEAVGLGSLQWGGHPGLTKGQVQWIGWENAQETMVFTNWGVSEVNVPIIQFDDRLVWEVREIIQKFGYDEFIVPKWNRKLFEALLGLDPLANSPWSHETHPKGTQFSNKSNNKPVFHLVYVRVCG